MCNKELYSKQLITQSCNADLNLIQDTNFNIDVDIDNWKSDEKMQKCVLPTWSDMRRLQENTNAWCFLNFFFFLWWLEGVCG